MEGVIMWNRLEFLVSTNEWENQSAKFGPVEVDTGIPYLDIFGVVFIVLAVAWGMHLIKEFFAVKRRRAVPSGGRIGANEERIGTEDDGAHRP